jgi:adenylate cyclase class IV
MRNIEFKSELRDLRAARAIALVIGARLERVIEQRDEYVAVPEGRLKRRTERDVKGGEPRTEWIWYLRADSVLSRTSLWTRLDDAQVSIRWPDLDRTVRSVIVKTRELWTLGSVRIHLDAVSGLGDFFELEGVCGAGDDPARLRSEVDALVAHFRDSLGEPIGTSYAEMA